MGFGTLELGISATRRRDGICAVGIWDFRRQAASNWLLRDLRNINQHEKWDLGLWDLGFPPSGGVMGFGTLKIWDFRRQAAWHARCLTTRHAHSGDLYRVKRDQDSRRGFLAVHPRRRTARRLRQSGKVARWL